MSTVVRLISSIVYVIFATVITMLVSRAMNDQPDSTHSTNSTTIKSMVSRPTGVSLDEIGGHVNIKEELRMSILQPMQHPSIFYGGPRAIRPPRGILLHGPPGTGKTMLARAIACECNVPLITLHSAALESKWWGESPKLLEAVFREARTTYAPCIIFFDEIDGLGRARNDADQSCVYSFKCELLRNIDTIDNAAVVVLACTNNVRSIDPALRRRFQRVLEVGKPSAAERHDILNVITRDEYVEADDTRDKRVKRDATLNETIAVRTEGYTGAELASLYEEASSLRMRHARIPWQRVRNGGDLVRRLGPLTLEHWEHAARSAGRPLLPETVTNAGTHEKIQCVPSIDAATETKST